MDGILRRILQNVLRGHMNPRGLQSTDGMPRGHAPKPVGVLT